MLPKRFHTFKNQSGQALLLVLLSMAVVLTVVLSASGKSVSDVSVGTYEEDALRAFSAAEAGIEQALLTNQDYPSTPQQINPSDTSVTFTSDIVSNPPGNTFVYPSEINTGESATFWFAGRNSNGNFSCPSNGTCYRGNNIRNLCWGNNSISYAPGKTPAVLLSIYYDTTKNYLSGDFSNVRVVRHAYDPDFSRVATNNFDTAVTGNSSVCGYQSRFRVNTISYTGLGIPGPGCTNVEGCLIMARVKVFYNDTNIPENVGIRVQTTGSGILPPQGNRIESTGVAGDSTRKINVFQSFPEPPAIFDAAVFSETSFTKS